MKKFLTIFVILLFIVSLVLPIVADAALVPAGCTKQPPPGSKCGLQEFKTLVYAVINFLLGMAGTVALLFMVWGGLRMLLSGGNPEAIKSGKSTLYNALIGFTVAMASFIILNLLIGTFTQFNSVDDLIQFLR